MSEYVRSKYESADFPDALEAIYTTMNETNAYIQNVKPWVLMKEGKKDQVRTCLYFAFESLRIMGQLLACVMPEKMDKLLNDLQVPLDERSWEFVKLHGRKSIQEGRDVPLSKLEPLFPIKRA